MKTILIVDDLKDFTDCLKFVLTQKGFKVIVAENGEQGVLKAITCKPDLILMDVFMPDQDGADTALQIKQKPDLAKVPIVFLTALTSGEESGSGEFVVQGKSYPAISKMTDQEEIVRQIYKHL